MNRALAPILREVGLPESAPFVPDPFQVESVEALAHSDVVVSAPTGSGKTWIALEAMKKAVARGERAWYASPLKALSNAMYAQFGQVFGPENVGILTGDRKENTAAPVIVGTTEILRNQLYDAMYRGKDLGSGLVILDEAHYLGDEDRGVVWEEVIIYLPVRVRLLLLSATVENADQIARWLKFVRGGQATTIVSEERPVPLYPIFLFPDGELAPLRKDNELFPKVRHHLEKHDAKRHRFDPKKLPPVGQVLAALEEADLLPAIFFLKSRADCDGALSLAGGAHLHKDPEKAAELSQVLDEFTAEYPFLKGHHQIDIVREKMVAAHHAGHLPHWKLVVERLMQKGLLKAIFSTSTVAAGVNFPARTVVITQSDRFNGKEFADLKATDLLQMTGRAGRRGMDKIGFCCVVPGQFNNVRLISSLLNSSPEPIESNISINFSMVLNLLLSQRPAEVKQLLGYSLATFQRMEEKKGTSQMETSLAGILGELAKRLENSRCEGPEEAVVRRRRRRQLLGLRKRVQVEIEEGRLLRGMWSALQRGRIFMDMLGELRVVLRREDHGKKSGLLSVVMEPARRLQKGKVELGWVPLDEVAVCYAEMMDLPMSGGGRALARAILNQAPEKPTPLNQEQLAELSQDEVRDMEDQLLEIEQELGGLECQSCPLSGPCGQRKGELGRMMEKAGRMLTEMQNESHYFWYDFVRHLEFLRSEGFAEADGSLTQDGRWASKLRLDRPVQIAEAIRKDALSQEDPVLLAALLALFVDDRERDGEAPYLSERLRSGINRLRFALDPLLTRQSEWGFSNPPMQFSAAAAVFAWGMDAEFEDAVGIYGGAEGDLAALIYRTADNLRQLISLRETHPRLADTAKEAVELLLRPPVLVLT